MSKRERLDADQKQLWDEMKVHVPGPSGGKTPQQSVNFGVLTFLFWCDFAGVGAEEPGEAAIRAEFERRGVPELCPPEDFWERLRRDPGLPWILAPGGFRAAAANWDDELLGRPMVVRMEIPKEPE